MDGRDQSALKATPLFVIMVGGSGLFLTFKKWPTHCVNKNPIRKSTIAYIVCRHYDKLLNCQSTLSSGTIALLCWSALRTSNSPADHRKPCGRTKMIQKNKVISLAIIGLVLGGIIGAVVNSEQIDMYTLAIVGGVIGFLVGWIWNSRSGGSEE